MNYILKYDFDPVNNCGIICFNNKQVLLDFSDLFSIINFEKNFVHYTEEKLYPYYLRHNQKISYLDFMLTKNKEKFSHFIHFCPLNSIFNNWDTTNRQKNNWGIQNERIKFFM